MAPDAQARFGLKARRPRLFSFTSRARWYGLSEKPTPMVLITSGLLRGCRAFGFDLVAREIWL